MTIEMLAVLVILLISLILFTFELLPPDVTGLGVLLALVILRLVTPEQAFLSFGSETFILLMSLLIISAAMIQTGAASAISKKLMTYGIKYENRLIPATMLATGTLSSFMSNTAAAAFFLPVILELSKRTKQKASRLLMPMAFAAILASSMTLIATSTNIVVSGIMVTFGIEPIGLFELTPVGLVIFVTGIIYMTFVGQRLIPERQEPEQLTERYKLRPYLAEVQVVPGSFLEGRTLAEVGLGSHFDLKVLAIWRGDHRLVDPIGEERLYAGDILVVEGSSESLLKLKEISGVNVKLDVDISDRDLQGIGLALAEVIILPKSPLLGRTPRELHLRERYRIQILAISRSTGVIVSKIADTRLQLGDILLIQGQSEYISALQADGFFEILGFVERDVFESRRAWLVVAIFMGALALGGLGVLPLSVSMLMGAFAVLATGCLTPEEAYRRIEWKVLILLASMLTLGTAMKTTGTAEYLASTLVRLVGSWHPLWLLSGFFLISIILTQPMSNQAAAAVVLPVALQTAAELGLNPRSFAIMIAIGASTSYMTPLEPACLIVYGPGRYRFVDFLKVGGPLTLIIFLLAIILVPTMWPLTQG